MWWVVVESIDVYQYALNDVYGTHDFGINELQLRGKGKDKSENERRKVRKSEGRDGKSGEKCRACMEKTEIKIDGSALTAKAGLYE